MRRTAALLLILLAGGAILAPLFMQLEPDPLPGDFAITWDHQRYMVPVLWSLCASGCLALLYSIYRR